MTGFGRVLSLVTAADMNPMGIGALAAADARLGGPLELTVSGFAAGTRLLMPPAEVRRT